MVYHNKIADYFFELLENNYYIYLKKIYNKTINEIMNIEKITILKSEHFILLQYYFIYLVNKGITYKSYILITLFINGFFCLDRLNEKIIDNFYIEKKKNLKNLKYYSSIILYYIIFLKLYISCSINIFNKIMLSSFLSSYYLLYSVNTSYKKRIDFIENNKTDDDYSRLLLFTSNKDTLKTIITYTNIFQLPLFIFFLNIFLIIIC